MSNQKNQQLILSEKERSQLVLQGNYEAKNKLDELLAGCFLLQKIYGKQPENIATINHLFHSILGSFEAREVIKAFELWLERSQEFPTPADIVLLIKRKGKPPLRESDIIAIRKKDGEFRTSEDWQMLKDWEKQQNEGFDFPVNESNKEQENISLRKEIAALKLENIKLADLLREARAKNPPPTPQEILQANPQEKINRTVDFMKKSGASENDIQQFMNETQNITTFKNEPQKISETLSKIIEKTA